MNSQIEDFYIQHERKVNNILLHNFYFIGLIPSLVLICNFLDIFHYPYKYIICSISITIFGMVLLFFLNKSKSYASYFKFVACFIIQIITFFFYLDFNLQLTVTYILIPAFSIIYFNPRFSIYACALAFFCSEVGIFISAEETVEQFWKGDTVLHYIVATSIGRFMEMLMISILIVTSTIVARKLLKSLKKRNDQIEALQQEVIFSFADMIESRDGTTGDHVKRTSQVVSLISEYIILNPYENIWNLSKEDLSAIIQAAPLHDIGKLRTPDSILLKKSSLTTDEFDIIKKHPKDGELIIQRTLSKVENKLFLDIACNMAKYHHEKWDGTGYPNGMKGSEIPISARIMAVADVLDALCSVRSYKKALSLDNALLIMKQSSGSQFEPKLIIILEKIKPQLKTIYENAM